LETDSVTYFPEKSHNFSIFKSFKKKNKVDHLTDEN